MYPNTVTYGILSTYNMCWLRISRIQKSGGWLKWFVRYIQPEYKKNLNIFLIPRIRDLSFLIFQIKIYIFSPFLHMQLVYEYLIRNL